MPIQVGGDPLGIDVELDSADDTRTQQAIG
jgi:hypothetical protein